MGGDGAARRRNNIKETEKDLKIKKLKNKKPLAIKKTKRKF